MEKWADKLVVAVRFNSEGTHIDQVRYHLDNGAEVDPVPFELPRMSVISELKAGVTYCTIYLRNGTWIRGARVDVFPVDGTDFVKTRPDGNLADNLEHLPEF